MVNVFAFRFGWRRRRRDYKNKAKLRKRFLSTIHQDREERREERERVKYWLTSSYKARQTNKRKRLFLLLLATLLQISSTTGFVLSSPPCQSLKKKYNIMCRISESTPTTTTTTTQTKEQKSTSSNACTTSSNNDNDSAHQKKQGSEEKQEKLRILICSENVPPQVNGIARRIGHYTEGLRNLGHHVDLVHPQCSCEDYFKYNTTSSNGDDMKDTATAATASSSASTKWRRMSRMWSFVNPWNSTAHMMILLPRYIWHLMWQPYDVVHCVLPLNLSAMWLLAAFKIVRCFRGRVYNSGDDSARKQPALIVSWHCNINDYISYHTKNKVIQRMVHVTFFTVLCWMLPFVTDRILTPTKSTDRLLTRRWETKKPTTSTKTTAKKNHTSTTSNEKDADTITTNIDRCGVCATGISLGSFHPDRRLTEDGQLWEKRKASYLQETDRQFLLLCVGRLSPEKGVEDLIHAMKELKSCALWLVGDGPSRSALESLANELQVPVKFWGYQSGNALHSVYTVADLFVCPSLTETFGQTVNEALASEVRVAIPNVSVFTEAYSKYLPPDAFWTARDSASMVLSIQQQLYRHENKDSYGVPDRSKLITWEDAASMLEDEYQLARKLLTYQPELLHTIKKRMIFTLIPWFVMTACNALVIYTVSVLFNLVCSLLPKSTGGLVKDRRVDMSKRTKNTILK